MICSYARFNYLFDLGCGFTFVAYAVEVIAAIRDEDALSTFRFAIIISLLLEQAALLCANHKVMMVV